MKAVNLLPNDQRGASKAASAAAGPAKAPSGDGFGAYLILGALALAVVAVAAMVLTKNTIADREAELAKTQAQAQTVAREAAALKPYADFKQLADARVQTVQALATTRFDWEQTLRDLSRALPREVRLSSLKGNVRGSGAGGTGPGEATVSPTIDLAGCTSSQKSVAKLMARLKAVRGVTRVALRSSAKAADTGSAVVTGPSGGTGASLCGKGAKPTFSLTVYFERFGVPAVNVPAGAAAGVAGATGPTGPTGATGAPAPGTTPTTPTTPQASAPNSATQGVSAP